VIMLSFICGVRDGSLGLANKALKNNSKMVDEGSPLPNAASCK
jgi:hypothetical protein